MRERIKEAIKGILLIFVTLQPIAFFVGAVSSLCSVDDRNIKCTDIRKEIFKPNNIASLISPGMYAGKIVVYLGCEFFTWRWE